jgi:NAD-dependent SIR2 family protein deacetylase
MTYQTDEQLLAEQRASGNFVDAECLKCHAKYYINTGYPQTVCAALINHRYCAGEIKTNSLLADVFTA